MNDLCGAESDQSAAAQTGNDIRSFLQLNNLAGKIPRRVARTQQLFFFVTVQFMAFKGHLDWWEQTVSRQTGVRDGPSQVRGRSQEVLTSPGRSVDAHRCAGSPGVSLSPGWRAEGEGPKAAMKMLVNLV